MRGLGQSLWGGTEEGWTEEASWGVGWSGPGAAVAEGEVDPCGSLDSEAGMGLGVEGRLGVAQWVGLNHAGTSMLFTTPISNVESCKEKKTALSKPKLLAA